jgi:NTP pyrophosphatase (non-canonical NTP hydrolase)
MTVRELDDYQREALRTAGNPAAQGWLFEKLLGLPEEVGEVLGSIKKAEYHGHVTSSESIKKELGDVLWYVACIAHWYGYTLSDVASTNIEKLRRRYPDGFSVHRSVNRGDE